MGKVPGFYTRFLETYPEVGAAYTSLSSACKEAGPLDERTAELVKLGISIGAGMSGATVLMATTTIGFPSMMRGLAWVQDVLEGENTS